VPIQQVVTQPTTKSPCNAGIYYQASPYKPRAIILGKRLPGLGRRERLYRRRPSSRTGANRRFGAGSRPSLYGYSQTFRIPGGIPENHAQAERRGFIALGRIEQYSAASCSGTSNAGQAEG